MNIREILENKNISYRDSGKDYLVKCFNPEHDDSNPSMRVHKTTGVFHCFSCGFKGNLLKHLNIEDSKIEQSIAVLKQKIEDYLVPKIFEMPELYRLYNKEYRGISKDTILKYEAFTTEEIDGMEDRLIFPIRDIMGNVRVFIGRSLHGNPKDKYKFYPGGITPPLFPAMPKTIDKSIILVEGIFDALNLIDKGLDNAMCAFGTTSLKKSYRDRLAYLKILGITKVWLMFDGDKAGQNASEDLEKKLSEMFHVERYILPEDLDPGALTAEQVLQIKEHLYEDSTG